MCAHDMLDAKREKLGMCLALHDTPKDTGFMTMPRQEAMQIPDLSRLMARRIMLLEGYVKSSNPHLAPEHIAAGLEAIFGPYLTETGKNPER